MEYNVVSDDAPEGMVALEIASAGQRFGGWLVDLVINILIVGAMFVVFAIDSLPILLIMVIAAAAWLIYLLRLIAYRGLTPGKAAMNIKIVRADGRPPGCRGMVLREIVARWILGAIPIIGPIWLLVATIWILFDDHNQGLHDKIAETYVVKV